MEDLGDILKRLGTRGTSGDSDGLGPSDLVDQVEQCEQCERCEGRGWYTPDVPVGHAEFGRLVTCDCQQDRREQEQFARLLRYSNLGYLSRFTFQTLNPEGRDKSTGDATLFRQAVDAAVQFAESPAGWLVFTGPHGSGKTHLAAAIGNRCVERGHVVFFVHTPDLLDHLRSTFGPSSEISYSDMFEQVRNTPLLILDDLGSQSTTQWADEKLRQIVNHRYVAELPTVLTVAGDLGGVDPYVLGRLRIPGVSRVLEVGAGSAGPESRLGGIEPALLRRMTFEAFDIRGNNPRSGQRASLEAAFQAARNFAADPHGWLTLFGETGVGKTHLAVAIAAERIEKGQSVFFTFVPELLDYLRFTYSPDSRVTHDDVLEQVKSAPLLVLDDLGQEQTTPWALEKLYQIVVHRHNSRAPTVITSSIDFTTELNPIGSRVLDPTVGDSIRMDAPDYRNKQKRQPRRQRRSDGASR